MPPSIGTLDLLRPRRLTARNRWRRAGAGGRRRDLVLALLGARFGIGILALLGALFWIGIFVFFARVLAYFRAVPELGPILAERLLGMVLLTFFSILLFSNVVTSLSTYFLSADLVLLRASPVAPARLHAARFLETLWDSSWMILSFGLPIFFAYGVVYRAGPAYYAAVLATLPPFLVIACAAGVMVTMLLMRVFPARGTRDVFLLLSVVAVALLYVLLRFLQPERLVRPEAFADFLDFLAAMQAPASPWLPSSWTVATLVPFFDPRPGMRPFLHYAALLTTAVAAFELCSWLGESVYASGWSKAQEGRRARLTRWPAWDRALARLPLSPVTRALFLKDAKTFFRDTSQWSQLVLLGALVVVYVYNFRVLPRAGAFLAQFYLEQALAFLNLALAGFVVASVSVRFLFPAISLEGKPFWLLKTAPIALRRLWWSKFWSGLVPLLTLGLALVVLGNQALGVKPLAMAVSIATLVLLALALTALGLCLGTHYPRFDYDNAAQIPSSFGGVVYMILSVVLVGANVAIEAWPVTRLMLARAFDRPVGAAENVAIIAALAAVVVLDLGVFVVATRLGVRRLENLVE